MEATNDSFYPIWTLTESSLFNSSVLSQYCLKNGHSSANAITKGPPNFHFARISRKGAKLAKFQRLSTSQRHATPTKASTTNNMQLIALHFLCELRVSVFQKTCVNKFETQRRDNVWQSQPRALERRQSFIERCTWSHRSSNFFFAWEVVAIKVHRFSLNNI